MRLSARRNALAVPDGAEIPGSGTSYDIDARVKAILQEGLSVYRVDAEKLEALRPDIIVTQDQCEVCAVSLKDVEEALHAWGGRRVEIVSLKPDSLADIWKDIAKVARALGREHQGERLVEQLKARMASIARQSGAARTRPRGAMIEWIDPLMAGGNWMPELVRDGRRREFVWRDGPTFAMARLGPDC